MLIFYTTAGCHLCDQAEALLRELQSQIDLQWRSVDIAHDPHLADLYGVRIPVVKKPEQSKDLGWPFDLEQLRQFVSGLTL